MNSIAFPKINHEITLLGGQSFAWDKINENYYGFVDDYIVKLQFDDNKEVLYWQTYPENDRYDIVRDYLLINLDIDNIHKTFPTDKYLQTSIDKFGKILILKQNFLETLISYLVTPTNNIPSIRYRIREMNKRLGRKVVVDDIEFYLFPKIDQIAEVPIDILLESKLGFHAKFMKSAAQKLVKDVRDLEQLQKAPSIELYRSYLKSFAGIGDKVADCVLIYGLGYYSEFPLDVWGQRIMKKYYELDEKMKYNDMRKWIRLYFGDYAGWAGQYLFEYIRTTK